MLYYLYYNSLTMEKKKDIDMKEVVRRMDREMYILNEIATADEVLERKVSKLGNSGHISIPSKHIGKDAKVIIRNKEREKEEVVEE